MTAPTRSEPGEARAWGWVAHLRSGGTTPWSAWAEPVGSRGVVGPTPTPGPSSGTRPPGPSGPVGPHGPVSPANPASPVSPASPVVPGAQQLELLRRLNATGRSTPAHLAERVLTASAPGRGRPDHELVGAAPPRRFGPAPVDPGTLPVDELVRVATGLLAEDVEAAGAHLPPPRLDAAGRHRDVPHDPRRPRRWRTAYLLGGDPWIADPARHHLVATGRPPGGRDATAVVVGTDLATMLVDAWTARCFGEGAPPWREFVAGQVGRSLAPRADLARAAARWSTRLGPARVVVVVDPALLPAVVGLQRPWHRLGGHVGQRLGHRLGLLPSLPGRPVLAAHATELARQVGPALGLLATPPRVAQLLVEVLLPRLADVPGERLVVPAGRQRWVRRQALRQRDAVLSGAGDGGYAVLGDPDLLLPRGHVGTSAPSEHAVLDLALRLLLEGPVWRGEAVDP